MSRQEFQIGGVTGGVWVLQTTGGARVSTITFSTTGAASILSLYDSVFAGTNLLNNITVAASGTTNIDFDYVLTNGLTATITNAASNATITIESVPGNPYPLNVVR